MQNAGSTAKADFAGLMGKLGKMHLLLAITLAAAPASAGYKIKRNFACVRHFLKSETGMESGRFRFFV